MQLVMLIAKLHISMRAFPMALCWFGSLSRLFWGLSSGLPLILPCWVDLFIRDVMDWVVWALECNRHGQLLVMGVLSGAFFVGSSCLIAF
jgi:hypothetical protein